MPEGSSGFLSSPALRACGRLRRRDIDIHASAQREPVSRSFNRSMEALLEELARGQVHEVLGDVNAASVEIQVLHCLVLLAGAKDDAERR